MRRMLGLRRGKGERWLDFETRSLRIARAKVFQMAKIRWGDKHLAAFWQYTGHLVRGGQQPQASVAGVLSTYRDLMWWNHQQDLRQGKRHQRHFPFLMNTERRIARVIGSPAWRVAACNRAQWKGFEGRWIAQEQIAWSSGRQPSLTM